MSPMHTALLAATLLLFSPAATAAPQPAGTWRMQNGKAEVQIAPCGPALCGKVSRVIKYPKDGARTDIHNRDSSLRDRPLLGLPVLMGFQPKGAEWQGRVYDPKSGRSYGATLTQSDPQHLTVKACVLFVCKTQIWSRVG